MKKGRISEISCYVEIGSDKQRGKEKSVKKGIWRKTNTTIGHIAG